MTRDESIIPSNWKQGKRTRRRRLQEKGNDSQFVHANRRHTHTHTEAHSSNTTGTRDLFAFFLFPSSFYCTNHVTTQSQLIGHINKAKGRRERALLSAALIVKNV
jgi:hypothetical protein